MMSLTCHDLTPELTRRWLDQQLGRDEQDALRAHLRGCLTCTRTISKTVSGHLFDFLTDKGQDHVQSFLGEVADLLKGGVSSPEPLSAAIQRLVARTRDLLWAVFVPSPTPALATMGTSHQVVLEEEDANGTGPPSPIVLTDAASIHTGPLLTGSGRFRLAVHGPESRLVGKDLCCDLQLLEGQRLVLRTPIRAASEASGWEATFDVPLWTDPSFNSEADHHIPMDHAYLRLVVRPSQA